MVLCFYVMPFVHACQKSESQWLYLHHIRDTKLCPPVNFSLFGGGWTCTLLWTKPWFDHWCTHVLIWILFYKYFYFIRDHFQLWTSDNVDENENEEAEGRS